MKKKFRIFLLEPNYAVVERPGFDEFMEPLNLCYIAKAAIEDGHEVIVKQQFDKSTDEIVQDIIDFKPDILALTLVTFFFNNAKEIVSSVKQADEQIISIAGGAHANGDPKECAEIFDYVIIGEGELPFLSLLEALSDNNDPNIPGVGYIKNGVFHLNNEKQRASLFSGIPYRDSLEMSKYTGIGNGPPPIPKVGFASMLLSKGCRFNCDFCINNLIWKDSKENHIRVVKRESQDVVQEMLLLQEKYNIGYIWFHDPDFPLYDREYMQSFFIEKAKAPLLKYAFMTRIDNILLDEDEKEAMAFLENLKKSGCHMIGFGIESFSPEILKEMHKNVPFNRVKRVIELVFDAGIIPVGFFIIGYPHETIKTINTTYEIAKKLKLLRYRFGIFYPYKGSARNQKINQNDWLMPEKSTYDFANHGKQVLKCNVPEGWIEKKYSEMNSLIYNESEFLLNLKEFSTKHEDMRSTMDSWLDLIKKYQKEDHYDEINWPLNIPHRR